MNRTFAACNLGAYLARRADARRAREEEHHAHLLDCTALCCGVAGERMEVVRLENAPDEAARLRDLGIIEGASVCVLRDGDPLLVRVGDARFGIGRVAATNVLCRPIACEVELCCAMKTTLDTLKPGDEATVTHLDGEPEHVSRLMEMGVLPGTPIKLVRFAPLGDPIEISARGYHLTLRRAEAAGVQVEKS